MTKRPCTDILNVKQYQLKEKVRRPGENCWGKLRGQEKTLSLETRRKGNFFDIVTESLATL